MMARHQDADARTRAEVEAWGCEPNATGAVFRSGGRSQDSAMGVGGILARETRAAPFDRVSHEDWQVRFDITRSGRHIYTFTHVVEGARSTVKARELYFHEKVILLSCARNRNTGVVSDLQADQRVVRQLVCANGIEADELTLAEVGVEGLAWRRSGHSSVGAWLW
ncbi:unnamed protein product [Ectocarpus sp. CCAP 1310/34]|nr:unnamed protein product [Ectocarpus sp. CCAP 1310/34]